MSGYRKLGRPTAARMSILRNLVTTLIVNGKVETTVTRAKEAQKIAEQLITNAVKESGNFTTREIMTSTAKRDKNNMKQLVSKTSKNDKRYDVVEREVSTKMVQVDGPSRLAVRREAMNWLNRSVDSKGKKLTLSMSFSMTLLPLRCPQWVIPASSFGSSAATGEEAVELV